MGYCLFCPQSYKRAVTGLRKIESELGLLLILPSITVTAYYALNHEFAGFIADWLENHEERANSMSLKIQKITDEYIEICIHGNILEVTIPSNFLKSCSVDGIISHLDCASAGTLEKQSNNMDTSPELMEVLNDAAVGLIL